MEINQLDRFSNIACHAAIELDHLSQGKDETYECVKKIEEWLTENVSDHEKYNSTAILVVQDALVASLLLTPDIQSAEKIVRKAVVFRDLLLSVSTYPSTFARYRSDDLKKLIKFCLELSKAHELYES